MTHDLPSWRAMEPSELVGVTEAEGRRLLDAARDGLDAPIAACPPWRVSDVLGHVASVYRRTTHVLAHRLVERPAGSDWYAAPPPGEAVLSWFDRSLTDVITHLERVDPTTPTWTFSSTDRTAAFWPRRLAHETTVHRIDVESAHGAATPVAPALAVDGIDEAFDVMIIPGLSGRFCGDDGSVHLHATDAPGEWLVGLGPEGVVVERAHGKGTAALRGPAADLFLWLWGRMGTDRMETFGDRGALDQFRAVVASVT